MLSKNQEQLAEELAKALYESDLAAEEKEEWAAFSAVMTAEQIREFVDILQRQTAEMEKELLALQDTVTKKV